MHSSLETLQPEWLKGAILCWRETAPIEFSPYIAKALKYAIDNKLDQEVIEELEMLYKLSLTK